MDNKTQNDECYSFIKDMKQKFDVYNNKINNEITTTEFDESQESYIISKITDVSMHIGKYWKITNDNFLKNFDIKNYNDFYYFGNIYENGAEIDAMNGLNNYLFKFMYCSNNFPNIDQLSYNMLLSKYKISPEIFYVNVLMYDEIPQDIKIIHDEIPDINKINNKYYCCILVTKKIDFISNFEIEYNSNSDKLEKFLNFSLFDSKYNINFSSLIKKIQLLSNLNISYVNLDFKNIVYDKNSNEANDEINEFYLIDFEEMRFCTDNINKLEKIENKIVNKKGDFTLFYYYFKNQNLFEINGCLSNNIAIEYFKKYIKSKDISNTINQKSLSISSIHYINETLYLEFFDKIVENTKRDLMDNSIERFFIELSNL